MLAIPDVISNESIINAVNFLGLSALFYFLLCTLKRKTENQLLAISAAFLVVMASTQFQFAATAGLETNFHLAIVFAGVYFFFSGARKWMWLFFALSVISKLDTVPLITILSLIHLWEKRSDYFGSNWVEHWKTGLLYAGIPLAGFVALTFILFDGPFPQSAYSKLYHHSHPSEHWFPFLELMLKHDNRATLVGFSILIPLIHLVLSFVQKRFRLQDFGLLLGFIGTMGLFYIYNPVERMSWYYAMPELLLYSQLVLSVDWIARKADSQINEKLAFGGYALMFAALCISAVPMTTSEKKWTDKYMASVEGERLEIGAFIAELPASDTLVAAHGHFGAYYKGYVLDLSGWNSKLATDHGLNPYAILSTYKPKYFIHHANDNLVGIAEELGYHPLKEWTKIEEYDYPKWVLWERK